MSQYYTKTELRNEIKKLKTIKYDCVTKMNEIKINSYMSEISSIREKIKKIEDDECKNLYIFQIFL